MSADDRCPRCGGAFHCGACDSEPCACARIALDAVTLAALRQRFNGCLCLNCLRELQREASASRAAPPSA
jgi:Cysteine-rich CWC